MHADLCKHASVRVDVLACLFVCVQQRAQYVHEDKHLSWCILNALTDESSLSCRSGGNYIHSVRQFYHLGLPRDSVLCVVLSLHLTHACSKCSCSPASAWLACHQGTPRLDFQLLMKGFLQQIGTK